MIRVEYLESCPDTIPMWTDCFWSEWQDIYQATGRTRQNVQESIAERCNRDCLPLAVVAFIGEDAIGTGCLKEIDFAGRIDLRPWIGGIYVVPEFRRRGVASTILNRLEHESARLGYSSCFLWTPSAEALYSSLGWNTLEQMKYCDAPATIMTKPANKASHSTADSA